MSVKIILRVGVHTKPRKYAQLPYRQGYLGQVSGRCRTTGVVVEHTVQEGLRQHYELIKARYMA